MRGPNRPGLVVGVTLHADGYASRILAWYSLIHFGPAQVPSVLRELARTLAPGGRLLLGLFEGDEVERIGDFPIALRG